MAWNNQGGGPWGGGGGPRGVGPKGGPTPPDLEEILRKGQESFKKFSPGGGGRGIAMLVLGVIAVWAAFSSYHVVQPSEQGVRLLFGKYHSTTEPGLTFWFPPPVGEFLQPNVTQTNQMTIGYRGTLGGDRGGTVHDVPQESLMLTGDQNIIDIDFVVQWRIKDASQFLFNIRDPESTIKRAAESAMREVVGQRPLEDALADKKQEVQEQTALLLQKILDSYKAGILIGEVKLQAVEPPKPVIDAFNDVQRAKQDQERLQNEAQAYRNDIVPRAKGEASRLVEDANAFKEKVTKEADGEAKGFLAVYERYKVAKDVTTKRLYLEHMQEILKKVDKVIIGTGKGGPGVVPYLPLPEIQKRTNAGGTQ